MADDIIVDMLRDQHREVLGRITALDGRLESTRVEIKNDLAAERATNKAELQEHINDSDEKYKGLVQDVNDLKTWRAKAVAYGTVGMFLLTFATQAIAGGHFPGIG